MTREAKRSGVWWWVALVGAAIAVIVLAKVLSAPPAPVPVWHARVVASYPHDPRAYCQGLLFHDGALYESTGKRGASAVRRVALESGEVELQHRLDDAYFGEGLTLVDDRLVQLTWQAGLGFVYDRATLRPTATFRYAGEGWGLAYDGERLIMSDGSAWLRFLDPTSFAETGRVEVRAAGTPRPRLNELEYVDGEVFANVLGIDALARIDPSDGRVTGWIQLASIGRRARRDRNAEVLNGIAWDAEKKRLFVTGKYWPTLFEIALVPPASGE